MPAMPPEFGFGGGDYKAPLNSRMVGNTGAGAGGAPSMTTVPFINPMTQGGGFGGGMPQQQAQPQFIDQGAIGQSKPPGWHPQQRIPPFFPPGMTGNMMRDPRRMGGMRPPDQVFSPQFLQPQLPGWAGYLQWLSSMGRG